MVLKFLFLEHDIDYQYGTYFWQIPSHLSDPKRLTKIQGRLRCIRTHSKATCRLICYFCDSNSPESASLLIWAGYALEIAPTALSSLCSWYVSHSRCLSWSIWWTLSLIWLLFFLLAHCNHAALQNFSFFSSWACLRSFRFSYRDKIELMRSSGKSNQSTYFCKEWLLSYASLCSTAKFRSGDNISSTPVEVLSTSNESNVVMAWSALKISTKKKCGLNAKFQKSRGHQTKKEKIPSSMGFYVKLGTFPLNKNVPTVCDRAL